MSEKITAPWTPEQVEALNAWQHSGVMHPFTCGVEYCGRSLLATTSGWICPDSNHVYCQQWAYDFMADPEVLTRQQAAIDATARLRSFRDEESIQRALTSEPGPEHIPPALRRSLERQATEVAEATYEKVPPEEFEWPCDRRDAHHEHEEVFCHDTGIPGIRPPDIEQYDCPGVRAHPATMAGTVYRLVRR